MPKLSQTDLNAALADLDGWRDSGQDIRKQYEFKDFDAALEFVNRVGALARAADHHPDIDIRYNKVLLALVTHSEGGITDKDVALAQQIEAGG